MEQTVNLLNLKKRNNNKELTQELHKLIEMNKQIFKTIFFFLRGSTIPMKNKVQMDFQENNPKSINLTTQAKPNLQICKIEPTPTAIP